MAKILPEATHIEIFQTLRRAFSDFHLFDQLVGEQLKKAISDTNNFEVNQMNTRKVVERYYDVASFTTSPQKILLAQIQVIFKAAYVLIASYQPQARSLVWPDVSKLLQEYPEFADQDQEELGLLLNFRNMLKITLLVIPARLNKSIILKIAGRLEGSQNEYITGGGQKKEVDRRVLVYEREGGITADKRPKRAKRGEAAAATATAPAIAATGAAAVPSSTVAQVGSNYGSTTNTGIAAAAVVAGAGTAATKTAPKRVCGFSDKKVKKVRLASDEVRFLSKPPADPLGRLPSSLVNGTAAAFGVEVPGLGMVNGSSASLHGLKSGELLRADAVQDLFDMYGQPATAAIAGDTSSSAAVLGGGGGCALSTLSSAAAELERAMLPPPTAAYEPSTSSTWYLNFSSNSGAAPQLDAGSSITSSSSSASSAALMPPPSSSSIAAAQPSSLVRDWSLLLPSLSREPSDLLEKLVADPSRDAITAAALAVGISQNSDLKLSSSVQSYPLTRATSASVYDPTFCKTLKSLDLDRGLGLKQEQSRPAR